VGDDEDIQKLFSTTDEIHSLHQVDIHERS
jgi:hypothetical protein